MRAIVILFSLVSIAPFSAFAEDPISAAPPSEEYGRIGKEIEALEKQYKTPYPAMLNAARNYVSVKAKEKELEATRAGRRGARWDSVGISGGINRSRTNPRNTTDPSSENASTSMSASISIALTSWFADRGIKLTEEIQRNAMRALQLQLAIEAANAHYEFTKSTNQLVLVGSIGSNLENLKFCAEAGAIQLNPENKALLDVQLTAVQLKLETIEAQLESAQSTLKRLIGKPYPNVLPLYKALLQETRRIRREDFCKISKDKGKVNAKLSQIPWDKIDTTFPVPATVAESARIARSSPALVTAGLSTDMARNQWHLAMAGLAPVLSFNFSRGRSELSSGGASFSQESDTYTVSLGFQIRGGIAYHLRSAELLEDAARLNARATELQILNSLEHSYLGLRSARASVQLTEHSLRYTIFPALNAINSIDDSNLKVVLSLFEVATAQVDALVAGINAYTLQRASILAQNGSLLRVIDGLKNQPEASRPR